jgi:hypothetical protein
MAEPLWRVEGTMAKAERDAIIAALHASQYHLTAAAARLRIGRSTLYRLIANYQIPMDAAADEQATRRPRSGRPGGKVRTPAPTPPATPGVEGPRIVHVNGAWYLLNTPPRSGEEA